MSTKWCVEGSLVLGGYARLCRRKTITHCLSDCSLLHISDKHCLRQTDSCGAVPYLYFCRFCMHCLQCRKIMPEFHPQCCRAM